MKNKICVPYLLLYILVPTISFIFFIILIAISSSINDTLSLLLIVLYSVLFLLWFALVPIITPILFRNSAHKKLTQSGFQIERIYSTFTYSLMIDIKRGKIAMLTSFNPFTATVISANSLDKIWIDTGNSHGNTKTNRVGVLFRSGNEVTRFDTYCQQRRIYLPINHPAIIAAIQKADTIAQELNEAWKNSSKACN